MLIKHTLRMRRDNMTLSDRITNKQEKISLVGLGYVGMPIAVAFAKKTDVIGFDLNEGKIDLYKQGIDLTKEVGDEAIRNTTVFFTSDESKLKEAKFHIIAVPTPVNSDKTPDLSPVEGASAIVGRNLTKGSIVVYESTVYPGVTEDICIPILEKESGLICGKDFKIGYSPERINPGDKMHRLENIKKIVSGMDAESLDEIAKVYELVIEAGVHRASSIKVAEAAKVVENSQRDINIAFMNELAMVFDRMEIDTNEVVEAMNTKWNALRFYPGLVGGHCIGVDPYYFVYQAEKLGYHSQIILSGRKINDGMGSFVADSIIKKLILANKVVKKSKVVILGITFKENCPDTRNSKVEDIIKRLNEYGIEPVVVDPQADAHDAKHEYGVDLAGIDTIKDADCLVFAVAHNEFKNLSWDKIDDMFCRCENDEKVIIDVKSILDKEEVKTRGYSYWRL
jgi:UDP-N-acetyl-D-glucosamine/UDP-N-acetyl-D-galactosamine dehydrogenase